MTLLVDSTTKKYKYRYLFVRLYVGNFVPARSFDAKPLTLGELCNMNLSMSVPAYQREFVWNTERVNEFLEDINQTRKSSLNEMFIGSMLMTSERNNEIDNLIGLNPITYTLDGNERRLSEFPEYIVLKALRTPKLKLLVQTCNLQGYNPAENFERELWLTRLQQKGRPPAHLIDGQQRWTTLSLISLVLKSWCIHYGIPQNLIDELTKFSHTKAMDETNENIIEKKRLKLREKDEIDLKMIFDRSPTYDQHRGVIDDDANWEIRGQRGYGKIRTAYQAICDWFDKFNQNAIWQLGQGAEDTNSRYAFRRYAEFFLGNICTIFINVTESNQQHAVFQSLNNAGEQLSQAELVKSFVLHKGALLTAGDGEADIQANWRNMVSQLERIRQYDDDIVTKFLQVYGRSKLLKKPGSNDKLLKTKNIFSAFKAHIESEYRDDAILQFTNNLVTEAEHFRYLNSPPHGVFKLHDNLIDYRAMGSQHMPFFLIALRKWGRDSDDIVTLCDLFGLFLARAICGSGQHLTSQYVEQEFNQKWIRYIEESDDASIALRRIKLDMWRMLKNYLSKNDWPPGGRTVDEIKVQLDNRFRLTLTSPKANNHVKYFLRKITDESGWGNAGYATFEFEAEHIFPNSQSPKSSLSDGFNWWTKSSTKGPGKAWGGTDWYPENSDQRIEIANKLGNFLILEKEINGKARRRTWKEYDPKNNDIPTQLDENLYKVQKNQKAESRYEDIQNYGGKYHLYKWHAWRRGKGNWKHGSEIQMVQEFVNKYRHRRYWTPDMINSRTNELVESGMAEDTWSINQWDPDAWRLEERQELLDFVEQTTDITQLNILGDNYFNHLNLEGDDKEAIIIAKNDRITILENYTSTVNEIGDSSTIEELELIRETLDANPIENVTLNVEILQQLEAKINQLRGDVVDPEPAQRS